MNLELPNILSALIPESLKKDSKSLWLSRVIVSMTLSLALIALVGSTVRLAVTGLFGFPGMLLVLTSALNFSILFYFKRTANTKIASILLISICWAVIAIFPFLEGGFHAPGLLLMLGIPLLAAVFSSLRFGIILTILSAAVNIVLYVLYVKGYEFGALTLEEAELGRLILTIFTFIFLMVVCWLFFNSRKIDEKKQQELINYLGKANSELREYSYAFSHDLKTPLRGIYTLTQFIEDELGEVDDDIKQQFDLIRGRVTRMQRYLDAMIEYTSIGMEKAELQETDINALLAELVEKKYEDQNANIEIVEPLPAITADREQLNLVFSKFFDNSITYKSDDHPQIKVEHADKGFYYQFSVSDNGIGIKEKYYDKIFKLFSTLGHKDDIENSGIGLTIAKKIIELNGGRISVTSEEGKGSTFNFTWPKQVEPYQIL